MCKPSRPRILLPDIDALRSRKKQGKSPAFPHSDAFLILLQNFLLFASRGFFHGPVRAQAGGTVDPLAEILERNRGEVRGVLESNKRIRDEWLKKQREKKLKEGLAILVD